MTVERFGKDISDSMLDEKELQKIKSNYKDQISHSQTLLPLSVNPQGGSDSSQFSTASNRKAHFHYGSYIDVAKVKY